MRRASAAIVLACVTLGCGGGAPLLHPAHVLRPGVVSMGAGVSGQVALLPREPPIPAQPVVDPGAPEVPTVAAPETVFEDLTVAPGVAPWVGGRIGIAGDNEAGLTYSGRAIRVDGRHAFALGVPTLSIGLGASAILARRPGLDDERDPSSVYGGGLDVPLLIGFRSRGDLYAIWFGPRVGFELLRGELAPQQDPDSPDDEAPPAIPVSGTHLHVGFSLGLRAGFRHVHVAVEAGVAYHRLDGEIGEYAVERDQLSVTPGGALVVTF